MLATALGGPLPLGNGGLHAAPMLASAMRSPVRVQKETTIMQRGMRKSGEPIYLRRHMIALALAVGLPIIILQLYKIYVGPISFGVQMGFVVLVSVLAGVGLYLTYRSSAQNQP